MAGLGTKSVPTPHETGVRGPPTTCLPACPVGTSVESSRPGTARPAKGPSGSTGASTVRARRSGLEAPSSGASHPQTHERRRRPPDPRRHRHVTARRSCRDPSAGAPPTRKRRGGCTPRPEAPRPTPWGV